VDRAALEDELKRAKQARQQYEKGVKKDDAPAKPSGPLKFDEDVPPDKILKLKNDMLVVSLKGLIDELAAMKPEHYNQHVDDKHNDFADWIENVIKRKKLAKKVRETPGKDELVKLLEEASTKGDDEEPSEEEPPDKEPPGKEPPADSPPQDAQPKPEPQAPEPSPPPAESSSSKTPEKRDSLGKAAQLVSALEQQGAKTMETTSTATQHAPTPQKPFVEGKHKSADLLLAETNKYVSAGDAENATKAYAALTEAYKGLPPTEKQVIAEACVALRDKIGQIKKGAPPEQKSASQEIDELLPRAEEYLKDGKKDLAMQTYQRIMRDYKDLPEDQKPAVFEKCNALYGRLAMAQ
jgi:hypothetical protein